jgi:hypothetical protein
MTPSEWMTWCRELGVAIHGDAADGIRNEMARLRAGHATEDVPVTP